MAPAERAEWDRGVGAATAAFAGLYRYHPAVAAALRAWALTRPGGAALFWAVLRPLALNAKRTMAAPDAACLDRDHPEYFQVGHCKPHWVRACKLRWVRACKPRWVGVCKPRWVRACKPRWALLRSLQASQGLRVRERVLGPQRSGWEGAACLRAVQKNACCWAWLEPPADGNDVAPLLHADALPHVEVVSVWQPRL